jgi:hypothetical protein
MDPFIENQRWTGFHRRFITQLSDVLVPLVRPRYEVEPEYRIYVERWPAPTVYTRPMIRTAPT